MPPQKILIYVFTIVPSFFRIFKIITIKREVKCYRVKYIQWPANKSYLIPRIRGNDSSHLLFTIMDGEKGMWWDMPLCKHIHTIWQLLYGICERQYKTHQYSEQQTHPYVLSKHHTNMHESLVLQIPRNKTTINLYQIRIHQHILRKDNHRENCIRYWVQINVPGIVKIHPFLGSLGVGKINNNAIIIPLKMIQMQTNTVIIPSNNRPIQST